MFHALHRCACVILLLGLTGCLEADLDLQADAGCEAGACRGQEDDGDSGQPELPDAGDASPACRSNADCDDGRFCTGRERCVLGEDGDDGGAEGPSHCESGPAPCDVASCDEALHRCHCDQDGDDLSAWFCGGPDADSDGDGYEWNAQDESDCDDLNPRVNPGQVEVCDYDGHDEDCNLTTVAGKASADPLRDKDNDTYVDEHCINTDLRSGTIHHDPDPRGLDCDDSIDEIHPGLDSQDESCDGRDNDCDRKVDEHAARYAYCPDVDGDGIPAAKPVIVACGAPLGHRPCVDKPDCDDSIATGSLVWPGHPEVCDAVDNDCDDSTPKNMPLPGKLLFDQPSYSDGTTATCDAKQGQWHLECPSDRLWCDTTSIASGCETDATRLSRCRSCDETACGFACGASGCDEATQIELGSEFACLRTQEGRAACWGRGAQGRLGIDDPRSVSIPTAVVGLTGVQAVSAGEAHGCAIAGEAGAVYCWGDNAFGQLANTDADDYSTAPVTVAGVPGQGEITLSQAAKIAAGAHHSCVVLRDGRVACWGETHAGRLGDGTTADPGTSIPVFVARYVDFPPIGQLAVPVQNAIDVSVGLEHSCLLTREGTVECWGSNQVGQLGADSSVASSPVSRPVGELRDVEQISVGDHHTCAVSHAQAWCWGLNDLQQLGRPHGDADFRPAVVAGLRDVAEIAAGSAFSCARTTAGAVYCWGGNAGGQQGFVDPPVTDDSSMVSSVSSEQVRVSNVLGAELEITQLSGSQFVCALNRARHVYCWGYNRHGQLGRGTISLEPEPEPKPIHPLAGSHL